MDTEKLAEIHVMNITMQWEKAKEAVQEYKSEAGFFRDYAFYLLEIHKSEDLLQYSFFRRMVFVMTDAC